MPKLEMWNVLTCSLWHSFYTLKNQFLSGLMKPQSCRKHFMVPTIMDDSQLIKEIASRRWHFMLQTLKTLVCTEVLWFSSMLFLKTQNFLLWCELCFWFFTGELNCGCINLKCQTLPFKKSLKLHKCFNYTALVVLCR